MVAVGLTPFVYLPRVPAPIHLPAWFTYPELTHPQASADFTYPTILFTTQAPAPFATPHQQHPIASNTLATRHGPHLELQSSLVVFPLSSEERLRRRRESGWQPGSFGDGEDEL